MDKITEMALEILQSTLSFNQLNKYLSKLNTEYSKLVNYEFLQVQDYLTEISNNIKTNLISVSVLIRNQYVENGDFPVNTKVRAINVGENLSTKKSLGFQKSLSIIIHSIKIEFVDNNTKQATLELNEKCKFNGDVIITSTDKEGNETKHKLSLNKFCRDVFLLTADEFIIQ